MTPEMYGSLEGYDPTAPPLDEHMTGNPGMGILYHPYEADYRNRPNQGYSLEQSRFINRIKNASRQMDTFYLQELAKKKQAEKEKYIHYLESQAQLNFGEDTA